MDKVDAIFFDFDGVLTDNYVYVDDEGHESVRCNRSDGLGFDAFRKHEIPCFIVTTDVSKIALKRSDKLRIDCYYGVENKAEQILEIAEKYKLNLSNCLYVGNDINDYKAMKLFGHRACPSDSHTSIVMIANIFLTVKGGNGVARELAEKIGLMNDLYNS